MLISWLKDDASKVKFALGDAIDNTMTNSEPLNAFPLWKANLEDDSLSEWIDDPIKTEAQREAEITNKATEIIENVYSPLKQRKLLSIAVALQDKVMQGGTLTVDEEALMQSNRDANTWITIIRTVENTAIVDGTLLEDIVWE